MKAKGRTLGAWLNHKRFNQRKVKGYTLSRRFDHRLSRLLSRLLFKLLPPRWYLRTQGVKLYREPPATATVTYELHGEVKTAQVEFGSAVAIIQMFPLWLKYGFMERAVKGKDKYAIPPHDILEVTWYDPVLKDYFSVS